MTSKNNIYNWSYAVGLKKADQIPQKHSGSWSEFTKFVDLYRGVAKGEDWIAAEFGGDGKRSKENARGRNWAVFDIDSMQDDSPISDFDMKAFIGLFETTLCMFYETSSSKPNARKLRVIAALKDCCYSGEAGELELECLGRMFEQLSNVKVDVASYRLYQPMHTPTGDKPLHVFDGEDVDPIDIKWITQNTLIKRSLQPFVKRQFIAADTPNVLAWFSQNGMVHKSAIGEHIVECPWADSHTGNHKVAKLYEPSANNNMAYGFHCFHDHCSHRRISDIFKMMGVRHAA